MLFKSFKNGAVTSLAIIAVIAGIATFGDLRLTTARANDSDDTYRPVSYTHLTLPTILRV